MYSTTSTASTAEHAERDDCRSGGARQPLRLEKPESPVRPSRCWLEAAQVTCALELVLVPQLLSRPYLTPFACLPN